MKNKSGIKTTVRLGFVTNASDSVNGGEFRPYKGTRKFDSLEQALAVLCADNGKKLRIDTNRDLWCELLTISWPTTNDVLQVWVNTPRNGWVADHHPILEKMRIDAVQQAESFKF